MSLWTFAEKVACCTSMLKVVNNMSIVYLLWQSNHSVQQVADKLKSL
jgi:hypothetical protein